MDFPLLEKILFFLQIVIPHSLSELASIESDFVSFCEVVIQQNVILHCHINNIQRRSSLLSISTD